VWHVEETVGRPPYTPVLGRFDTGARIPNAPWVAEMLAGSPQVRPGIFLTFAKRSR
jgi:hypothetical protein